MGGGKTSLAGLTDHVHKNEEHESTQGHCKLSKKNMPCTDCPVLFFLCAE